MLATPRLFLGTFFFIYLISCPFASAATPRGNENGVNDRRYSVVDLIQAIKEVRASAPAADKCVEKKLVANSTKFVTSLDENGRPCKVYDLAFPTLAGVMKSIAVASVPMQKLTSQDYNDWLNGDFDKVYHRLGSFDADGKLKAASVGGTNLGETWYSQIPFKDKARASRVRAMSAQSLEGATADQLSFRLSEVETSVRFTFSKREKALLKSVLAQSSRSGMVAQNAGPDALGLPELIDQPDKLLERINFQWDEARKVFDVFVELDFLPLLGPIDLVDYNVQHKYLLEKAMRSVVARAIGYLTKAIPSPTARGLIQLGTGEAFGFIEDLYEYHRNQLEGTLRMNLDGTLKTELASRDVEFALDVLYAGRLSLVNEVLMSKITGTKLDLKSLHKRGNEARYQEDKSRRAMLGRLNSDLALKKGCEMSRINEQFGLCTKDGKPAAVYSLLSQHSVLMFNLGAPMVYNNNFPAAVAMKRVASYLMAMALQVYPLPIPAFVTSNVIGILKGFATAGARDEAYLLNYLSELKRTNGMQDETSAKMMKWLYGQNVNPFLVKWEAAEDRLITVNARALKSKMGDGK